MGKLLCYNQVRKLVREEVDPPLIFSYDIPIYLPGDYPTTGHAIDAAIRIGYNLGLRAARGEDLAELPAADRGPNPLLESIRNNKE